MQQALRRLKPKLPTWCGGFFQRYPRPPYMRPIAAGGAATKKAPRGRRRSKEYLPFLCRSSSTGTAGSEEIVGELVSMPGTAPMSGGAVAPLPSPVTPACARLRRAREYSRVREARATDEACRTFENYLVEMIVEEGEVRDLVDVEELLYCWEYLREPAFVELVSRFYGDLCRDLFSEGDDEAMDGPEL